MAPIPAQLTLEVDTPGYSISEADFLELKKAVGAEFQAHVPAAIWTAWSALGLPSYHPTATEVRDEIVAGLGLYNNDPGQTWALSLTGGNTGATPLSTFYVFENGERVCHCTFALDVTKPSRPIARWEVSYTNPSGTTYSIGINAHFSWATPWSQ